MTLAERKFVYTSQDPQRIEVLPGSAGFVVLLNQGSSNEAVTSLFRAFNVEARISSYVMFTPSADGARIIDVLDGEFPDTGELQTFLDAQLKRTPLIYAGGPPQTIKGPK